MSDDDILFWLLFSLSVCCSFAAEGVIRRPSLNVYVFSLQVGFTVGFAAMAVFFALGTFVVFYQIISKGLVP